MSWRFTGEVLAGWFSMLVSIGIPLFIALAVFHSLLHSACPPE